MLLLALLTLGLSGAQPVSPRLAANAQSPRWSPDGSALSYELNFHEQRQVQTWVLRAPQPPQQVQPRAGAAGSSLTAGFETAGSQQVVHELAWSPESVGAVVYASSGVDRDYELYLAPSENLLGGTRIAASPGADGGAQWSPDGKWIAFSSARSGQGDIYLLSVQHLDQPPHRISTDERASELFLAWAPGGDKLAWVGHTATGDSIYIVDNMLRPSPRTLVSLGQTQTRPSFSPDGRSVAFYSNHQEPSRFDLYTMELGGEPKQLAQGVVMNQDGPTWSPDGQWIVYVADLDERFDPVMAVPTAGGPSKPLETGTVGNGDLDLTVKSDGRPYLAVSAQGRESDEVRDFKQIYVMAVDL